MNGEQSASRLEVKGSLCSRLEAKDLMPNAPDLHFQYSEPVGIGQLSNR